MVEASCIGIVFVHYNIPATLLLEILYSLIFIT